MARSAPLFLTGPFVLLFRGASYYRRARRTRIISSHAASAILAGDISTRCLPGIENIDFRGRSISDTRHDAIPASAAILVRHSESVFRFSSHTCTHKAGCQLDAIAIQRSREYPAALLDSQSARHYL